VLDGLLERVDHSTPRSGIGGEYDVVDITDPDKRLDVTLVRVGRQGVAEEEDCRDVALRDERANLLVTTKRPRLHLAGDLEP